MLAEKPFVVSSSQCGELQKIAAQQQCFTMEAMWTWFLPAVQEAVAWVKAGRIGNIQHIKADFGYPIPYAADQREYDATLNGGCLLEMGIYPVALAWLFMQKDPVEMQAVAHKAPNKKGSKNGKFPGKSVKAGRPESKFDEDFLFSCPKNLKAL